MPLSKKKKKNHNIKQKQNCKKFNKYLKKNKRSKKKKTLKKKGAFPLEETCEEVRKNRIRGKQNKMSKVKDTCGFSCRLNGSLSGSCQAGSCEKGQRVRLVVTGASPVAP